MALDGGEWSAVSFLYSSRVERTLDVRWTVCWVCLKDPRCPLDSMLGVPHKWAGRWEWIFCVLNLFRGTCLFLR